MNCRDVRSFHALSLLETKGTNVRIIRCFSGRAGSEAITLCYLDATMPGGFHVPSPAGRTEGDVSLGQ